MATNLKIDSKLIEKARRLGKKKTKREAVTEALEEYIRRREVEGLISLFGKVDVDADYDYKAERRRSTDKNPRRYRKSA